MTSDRDRLAVLRAIRDCESDRFCGSFAIATGLPALVVEPAYRSLYESRHIASDRRNVDMKWVGGWYITPAGIAELARLEADESEAERQMIARRELEAQ